MMYRKFLKRPLDIFCSLLAIIVLSPLLLVLFVLVRIKLGAPVLFKQERVGKDKKIFTMYKFRTMIEKRDEYGNQLSDEARLTKFGSFLRSTSLDELPELFNILIGDLSIVGPRSLLVEYLPYYNDFEMERFSVRGGLTPPEVIYGNVQPTWKEQFEYEVDYANNITFLLDVKIIVATIKGVFKRNSLDYGNYVRKSLIAERTASEQNIVAYSEEKETVTAEM